MCYLITITHQSLLLRYSDADVEDTGAYSISIGNQSGQVNCEFEVNVKGF